MTFGSNSARWCVATVEELSHHGAAKCFSFRDEAGYLTEGFVIRFRDDFHAYVNRCPHVPLTLDYGDGEFFDENREWLVCRNHGAVFDPTTGRCVAGPPCGASLQRLAVHIEGRAISVEAPPLPEDFE